MSLEKSSLINQLQRDLPEGLIATTSWLNIKGYSNQLLRKYLLSHWLESPARSAYRRPGPPLKWQQVVASLQLLNGLPLHVGGKTALVHRGLGHYAQLGGVETIQLFGPSPLPPWVRDLPVKEHFVVYSDAMFDLARVWLNKNGQPQDKNERSFNTEKLGELGLNQFAWGAYEWSLIYSSEERAIFEVLQNVPEKESVYEAYVLLQGLVNLRPQRVSKLLAACRSIKVKRLFLALATRCQHAWLKHVTTTNVDLGKGKRMLVPGGKLDPKYLITLPADLDDHAR
jgi:Transcriptional regulator, AbiEi antitoxin, Type IV TA system/Transcriptional regulator, AbiEi antitoxin N-terminal domain